jgi:teichuronic acid biosynthesis glycosyltransferase TuaC
VKVLVVTNMYPSPQAPSFGTYVYDQVQALREAGAEVDVFHVVQHQRRIWNYVWAIPRLWRLLMARRYDLIHAHYVLSGVVARAQWGHRVVLTHHGPEVLGQPRWQAILCKLVTPLFDEVIHVTEEVRRVLHDADGWVIPCGVNLDVFMPVGREEARQRLGLPLDTPLVLWAGEYWRPEKRFDLVQQAMQLTVRQVPRAELVLLANKPHEVVPLYMSACDVLILTSALEGSPMVVKEAMACNLPIVSVQVGDVPDVIRGTIGCALAERDPQDLAAKLVPLLQRPRRSDGRQRIEHLSHARVARRILAVYARALRSRRPTPSLSVERP